MPADFTLKMLPVDATLRDYQNAYFVDVMQQLDSGKPGSHLYASPTGSGKSVMALTVLGWLPDALLITPRLEIVAGMLAKGGIDATGWSDAKLAAEALQYRISTPIRARNMLAKGEMPWRPNVIIWDEAHHRSADSYKDIRTYLGGGIAEIGLTATPFRGTPKGTEEFLESWDTLTWVLDYPEAARRGVIAVPSCSVRPLIDDDELEVTNGEITIRSAGEAVIDRLDEVVRLCVQFRRTSYLAPDYHGCDVVESFSWDRPTLFAVPDTASAYQLAQRLRDAHLPAVAVTQDTPRAERGHAFAAAERGEVAIVQIDVVSEGVDLKLRRLIDLRPTLSPVKWLQQVGRITRPVKPGEIDPEYICCNRNLERHCYLYAGCIPPKAVVTAQQAFERPTKRAGLRAVGLEGLGRFAGTDLPLADGTVGVMYQISTVEGFQKREFAVLVHPCSPQPIYATRENQRGVDGMTLSYGKWRACEKLPDLKGFGSAPASKVSDKQKSWWQRDAARFGLDSNTEPNRRNFAALPLLKDIGARLQVWG